MIGKAVHIYRRFCRRHCFRSDTHRTASSKINFSNAKHRIHRLYAPRLFFAICRIVESPRSFNPRPEPDPHEEFFHPEPRCQKSWA
jgi:hypothetical protein